jgi:hypothetical protein
MTRSFTICGLLVLLGAGAASAQPARIAGQSIGGHMDWDPATRTTRDTSTCTFTPGGDAASITVDFVVQYAGEQAFAVTRPAVVDIIVTEHPANEDTPEMAVDVDGRTLGLLPRPRSSRSVVSTISFEEFLRIANANTIVQRAFDRELVFGEGQRRMLRSVAGRWSGASAR